MNRRAFGRKVTALCAVLALSAMTPPESPVADAAMRGDVETVRELLRRGADVNEPQGDGMTALHWAARHGNAELAEILVYAGAKLDAGTRIGHYTPLHIAAREGRRAVVVLLLEAGADPDVTATNSGARPLHLAARSGNPEIVSRLLEHGAYVDATESAWGQTPLTFASAMNRTEVIEVLLAAGADPNAQARAVDVVEMAAADQAAEERLQEALERFKEREGGGPGWQPTPSQVQAAVDLARQVQIKWPDVPQDEGEEGENPEAAEEEPAEGEEPEPGQEEPAEGAHEEPGQEQEQADAAVNPEEDAVSEPPAEDSAADEESADAQPSGGDAEDEGAQEGASPEGEEETPPARPMSYAEQVGQWGGLTPLHHAVRQGHVEAALALLDGGAEIDRPSGDDTTPLLMAAINGQWDLATILLDRGADPTIASTAGATPLYTVLEREWQPRASYAHPTEHQQQETGYLDLMRKLLDAGADPDARLTKHLWYMEYTFGVLRGSGIHLDGATPFWRASYALDVEAMRLLASYGADPDVRTKKPPERRRRQAAMEEEEEEGGQEPAAEGEEAQAPEGEEEAPEAAGAGEGTDAAEGAEAPQVAEAEQPSQEAEPEEPANEEDEDKSGLPPIAVGGPAIHALHAASGVGYGQSFAGNAHRYVPNGWLPAVKFLVEEMGADVNARDANGYTALHHAASRGDIEMILYLVEHGADVTVVSRKGETTADMANGPVQRVQPYPEAVALLEQLGSTNNHNCVSCQ